MQFQFAELKNIDGFVAGKSSISKRLKLFYQEIFNNLFTLREVEITMVEKGNHTLYKYKKSNRSRRA